MKLGRHRSETSYTLHDDNHTIVNIEEHQCEKDLGVTIDNRLSFKAHIADITTKANRIVGIIRHSFDHLVNETFV